MNLMRAAFQEDFGAIGSLLRHPVLKEARRDFQPTQSGLAQAELALLALEDFYEARPQTFSRNGRLRTAAQPHKVLKCAKSGSQERRSRKRTVRSMRVGQGDLRRGSQKAGQFGWSQRRKSRPWILRCSIASRQHTCRAGRCWYWYTFSRTVRCTVSSELR